MSSAEQVHAKEEAQTPAPNPAELERIRAEDPEFPVVLAKVRARHRGEEFDPEKHLPKEGRRKIDDVAPEVEGGIQEIIGRFMERAARGGRHLRAIDAKKAAANDAS